ncbi:hypothetical protein B9P84_20520 [Citrobacter braakii]|nr:hypothetical protein B9P84_20520 [Citrobacter braakii]
MMRDLILSLSKSSIYSTMPQSMSKSIHGLNINTGIYRRFMVRRGLQERILQGIALSIFLSTSHRFESLQDFWPYTYLWM